MCVSVESNYKSLLVTRHFFKVKIRLPKHGFSIYMTSCCCVFCELWSGNMFQHVSTICFPSCASLIHRSKPRCVIPGRSWSLVLSHHAFFVLFTCSGSNVPFMPIYPCFFSVKPLNMCKDPFGPKFWPSAKSRVYRQSQLVVQLHHFYPAVKLRWPT